jgi:hypothetical protein
MYASINNNHEICNGQFKLHTLYIVVKTTVKPVLRDHSGENAKVVSYSRWSFNTGSTKNNVVIDRCYSTTS